MILQVPVTNGIIPPTRRFIILVTHRRSKEGTPTNPLWPYDQPGALFFHCSIQRPSCRGPTAWSLTLRPQWRALRQLARNAAHRLGGERLGDFAGENRLFWVGKKLGSKNQFLKINIYLTKSIKIPKKPPIHGHCFDILGKLRTIIPKAFWMEIPLPNQHFSKFPPHCSYRPLFAGAPSQRVY